MDDLPSLMKTGHASLPLYVETGSFPIPGQPDISPNALKPNDNADARKQLVQAGQQFEAYFVSHLLKVMRETVHEGAIQNRQGAYFHSFYDQEIGLRAAQAGGIGITRMVQEYADKYFSQPTVERSSSSR